MNKEAIIKILQETPLNISSTRRDGANGLRNADDIAEKFMLLVYKDRIKIATIQGLASSMITCITQDLDIFKPTPETLLSSIKNIHEEASKLLEE